MKTQTEFKNQIKETLNELKGLFEEMEVQVNLGKKEAKEVFERERQNFTQFVRDQRQQWRGFGMMSEENLAKIKQSLHTLYTLLVEGTPEIQADFQVWKDKRLHAIYELEFLIREIQPGINETEKEVVNDLKVKLDVYRIHLALSTFEKTGDLITFAEELRVQLDKTIHFFENEVDDSWERVENFKEELGTSFEHLKKAFGGLMGK
jgi:meiotically up-regulated gene 157 (Mug157) protein